MTFWEDMQGKWGFSDGDAVPAEALIARQVYIQGVNVLAERFGSQCRCVAYNRQGMHNSILILKMKLENFKTLTPAQVIGEEEWDETLVRDGSGSDEAMEKAIETAGLQNLDDLVCVTVQVSPDLQGCLEQLATGVLEE